MILVLLLVVLLAVVVAQVSYTTQIDAFVAANTTGGAGLRLAARGAVPIVRAFLAGYVGALGGKVYTLEQKVFDEAVGGGTGEGAFKISLRAVGEKEDEADPSGFSSGGTQDQAAGRRMAVRIEDPETGLTIDLVDEGGKIPINNLAAADRWKETYRHLVHLRDALTKQAMPAADYWSKTLNPEEFPKRILLRFGRTPPPEETPGAPGSQPPAQPQPPIGSGEQGEQAQPIADLSEILLDPQLLLDPEADVRRLTEGGTLDDGETVVPGLAEYLSVWGAGSDGKINLNTASREVLYAVLPDRLERPPQPNQPQTGFDPVPEDRRWQWADQILARRAQRAIAEPAELVEILGEPRLFGSQPTAPQGSGSGAGGEGGTGSGRAPRERGLKDMLTGLSRAFTAVAVAKDETRVLEYRGVFRVDPKGGVQVILWDEVEPPALAAPAGSGEARPR